MAHPAGKEPTPATLSRRTLRRPEQTLTQASLTDGHHPSLSLAESVYRSIRDALRRGEWPTGSRLIEGDLAQAMEVSRTPIRQALGRLEADGLIRPAANRGYVVADLMADAELVFLIRERIEGLAAGLAARHIAVPDLEALTALQAQMEQAIEEERVDVERLVDLNFQFHHRVTLASQSPRLERLIERLHPEYVSYQVIRSYDEEGRRRSITQHRAILDALWHRDVESADRLTQAHLESGKAVVLNDMNASARPLRPG